MMVTFISQCEKNALKKTRRVLDAFANRIGDNTWQTIITQEGLQATRKLLRKTASKNTAVSCHWIRSRSRSDLLWVVGKKHEFNQMGYVPVNRTRRNILHNEWKNDWVHMGSIQIIASLAALLHDIGKSTIGFQSKLTKSGFSGDPYRHEWISLKLFEWLVEECDTDQKWLQRFAKIDEFISTNLKSNDVLLKKITTDKDKSLIHSMPPLAQWLAWLIVTHHRLPPFGEVFYPAKSIKNLKGTHKFFKSNLQKFYQHLEAKDYWVKNPNLISGDNKISAKKQQDFWDFDQLVIHSQIWQKSLKRWANKALNNLTLLELSKSCSLSDPLLLHLSRLSLMVGDHNYSSLQPNDKRRISGDTNFKNLAANTDRKSKLVKQSLDEHLLGVCQFTAKFSHIIPIISQDLPKLENHKKLAQDTNIGRFQWQNNAAKLARKVQYESQQHGFFGVNMASTGCGKTIGNARIMYALSEKEGARFTVALGLRILTLQTGDSFRDDLELSKGQSAILVGGDAQKQLYEFNKDNKEDWKILSEKPSDKDNYNVWGSESAEHDIDGYVDADIDYTQYDDLNLGTVIENSKARDLLFAPIITCTIDHIIQASECKRSGGYMAPMLRLLSSDLILDEPDDFDQSDLPALCRLVHLAGMLGSRILLSSATLPPDLIGGLFKAYLAGREIYNKNMGKHQPRVICAWFDEQKKGTDSSACSTYVEFIDAHGKFIGERQKYLEKEPIRRQANILSFNKPYSHEQKDEFFSELAKTLIHAAIDFHRKYKVKQKGSQKQISFGLIRIANIENIIEIAQSINQADFIEENYHIHLACYHAKQLLILRNALETKLDRILKRNSEKPEMIFNHPEIKNAISDSNSDNHLFIVLATPVAEVGRDHDYDWAIVEPSSMRSIIQLAGRIWRHRPTKVASEANMLILQYNIRHLKQEEIVFTKPGFESEDFQLDTHDTKELITDEEMQRIDSVPRMVKPKSLSPSNKLSHLEHAVMADLINNQELNFVNAYWQESQTSNRSHTHLQILSPFRKDNIQEEWLLIPNQEFFDVYAAEQVKTQKISGSTKQNNKIRQTQIAFNNKQVSPWLLTDVVAELKQLQTKYPDKNIRYLATQFSKVALEDNTQGWCFNEWLGFWRNK